MTTDDIRKFALKKEGIDVEQLGILVSWMEKHPDISSEEQKAIEL